MDISIVVPCYNEEEGLFNFYTELKAILSNYPKYEIIFVNDGSSDGTINVISKIASADFNVKAVILSRNFGHQSAIMAGLINSSGKVVLTMDADLQHPPSLIPNMLSKLTDDVDIVATVRIETEGVGLIKKITSKLFYGIINIMSNTPIQKGAADFRLMNRKALDAFISLPEKVRFNRGLVSWLGFNVAYIDYSAPKRTAGKSKYSFLKMLKFAVNGITSFSSKPLQIPIFLGLLAVLLGFFYTGYIIYQYSQGQTIQGWASTVILILFLGGIQMFSIGIMGIYIAKIFEEVKNRPSFIVKEKINFDI
jgi:polyisoprenyl-phosphate glycosyltransferase